MSSLYAASDAAVVGRIRASFARQGAMATIGAELADIAAGRVAISLAIAPRLSQQHGFLVLTAEFKMNLLAPASGDSLVAEGQVVRAGRTLTVCRGDAFTEGVKRVHERRCWQRSSVGPLRRPKPFNGRNSASRVDQ